MDPKEIIINNKEFGKYTDRRFKLPRFWSNQELKKFAHLFEGDIVNASGWKDEDKQGAYYKDYFTNASSYTITNFKSDARGFQGKENEIFLDLTKDIPIELEGKFQVVFNHTVLEHIYEVHKAFQNLCSMSKEAVILVVPFLQEMHADYGDFWRFTPLTIKRLFEDNRFELQYLTFNGHKDCSVYLFAIGLRPDSKFKTTIPYYFSLEDPTPVNDLSQNWVGCHAIQNKQFKSKKGLIYRILHRLGRKLD